MKINPKDVFQSFSKFILELTANSNNEFEEYKNDLLYRSIYRVDQDRLFDLENKYFLLSYIFNSHKMDKINKLGNIDIYEVIKRGKLREEEIDIYKFLDVNPELLFYRYILLKDPDRKYNIGYFTENIRIMIKTLVGLNIFFLDAYILCKVISKVINWQRLTPQAHSETKPLSIGFNNILMVGYRNGKPYLTVNEDGMKTFASYSTGKISVGLYSGDDLLYCRKISVPDFHQKGRDANFNQYVREVIFKNKIGEDRKVKWSDLLPEIDPAIKDYPSIYKEVTDWLSMIDLLCDFSKTAK